MSTEEIFAISPITDRYVPEIKCSVYGMPGIETPRIENMAEHIINIVLTYRNLTWEQVVSSKRSRHLVYARGLCFYFLRSKTEMSFKDIGKRFGDRDHTTVIHGLSALQNLIDTEDNVKNDIEKLAFLIGYAKS